MTMFQYKVVHNILATKATCDHNVCLNKTHYLDHMFYCAAPPQLPFEGHLKFGGPIKPGKP